MRREDYVSLNVAKMLKEKGYKEICTGCYRNEEFMNISSFNDADMFGGDFYAAPNLYEAQKWIWRSHKMLVTAFIKAPFGQPYEFIYCIQDAKNTIDDYGTIVSDKPFDTYEEALNAGILEALKLICL